MNTCPYCGAQYPDEVIVCPVDNTRMVEEPVACLHVPRPQKPPIEFRARLRLLAVAWLAAVIAVAIPDPRLLVAEPLLVMVACFPFGTFLFLSQCGLLPSNMPVGFTSLCAIGWLFYAALTSVALLTRKRVAYFVVYGILCVLLLLNVVGCHMLPPPGTNLM